MSTLMLASPKLIAQNSPAEWAEVIKTSVVLFTGSEDPQMLQALRASGVFSHIETFSSMPSNDLVEKRAIDLHQVWQFKKIISLTEADLLRAARLRETLRLPGQSVRSAQLFRDKFEMKTLALSHGVPVARFSKVCDTLDLLDFINKVGYPVVIKPLSGRGSADTFVIRNDQDLNSKLQDGIFGATNRLPDLLAEEFIEGDMYHIDGLFLRGKKVAINASRYLNDCLSFVNGSAIGSHLLENENPLKARIEDFVENILTRVFPLPEDSIFHVEVFVTPAGNIVLCEVACRVGGNGIQDPTTLLQGIDIKMEYVRSECCDSTHAPLCVNTAKSAMIAGRVLIPPQTGLLTKTPTSCPFPWVVKIKLNGKLGRNYHKMERSNDEILNALIVAKTELEFAHRMDQIVAWYYQESRVESDSLSQLKSGGN
jgi:ATP-grasp domain